MAAARALVLAGLMSCAAAGLAQAPEDLEAERVIAQNCKPDHTYRFPAACSPTRFRSYEPNYGVYQWTQNDESAIRVHYSFRYLFFTADCIRLYRRLRADALPAERQRALAEMRECFTENRRTHEWYAMYTGEFDFYWGTRASGPVINRISNPGFHYRDHVQWGWLDWWDVGIEHRSDGQTVDPRREELTPAGPVRVAEVAYQRGDHAYFDTISRDTNYLVAEGLHRSGPLELQARVKWLYFGNETDITWGPLADQNVKMRHYDRFRFIVRYTFGGRERRTPAEQRHVFAEWTLGDNLLQSDSLNAGVYFPIGTVPLFVRVHLGPMHTLSNYTQSQSSIGFGLMFLE